MHKKVSIIIPTYNEEKNIRECFESIARQSYDLSQVEILVVDGISKDNTLKIVSDFENILPIRVLKNSNRKVTYALNIGIKNSIGDYIIRLDAHSVYDFQYIEKCVYYLENIECDNVGGVAETKGNGFIGEINADILSSKFGVGGSKFRTDSKSGYVDTVPFGAFRRGLFDEIGLFDVNLPRSEDNDINSRIRENGGKVYLASDIKFIYYCRNTFSGLLDQAIKNGNALFFTLRKNKKAMSLRHFVPFLFACSILLLVPLSFFFLPIMYIFFTELGVYFLLDFIFSMKGKLKFFIFKMIMYPIFHFVYGIGSLLSLIGIKMY